MHQCRLGADGQSSSPAETGLAVDAQLSISQQCTLITHETKCILSNTDWLKVARDGENILFSSAQHG